MNYRIGFQIIAVGLLAQAAFCTVLTMDTGSPLTDGFAFDDGPSGYVGNPSTTQGYGDYVSDLVHPVNA